MANTYTLISSNVLSSSAASVTFSAIPSTMTDLVIRASVRNDLGSRASLSYINFNSDSAQNYSNTRVRGDGSTASSTRYTTSNASSLAGSIGYTNGSTTTSNTFSSFEIYVPNYALTNQKAFSVSIVNEDNGTTADAIALANLYNQTTAISSFTIYPGNSVNWVSGSSFYLYGIKNS